MIELRHWNTGLCRWDVLSEADDGFVTLCASYQRMACDYYTNTPITAVDRERLLTLTAGKFSRSRHWHRLKNLPPFIAESDERTKRLTFTHEGELTSKSFRNEHLAAFIKLQMTILPDASKFPPTIQDLRGNWKIRPPAVGDDYRFNLGPRDGNIAGATVIYLGIVPPEEALRLRDDMAREWAVEKTRRLVVWYEYEDQIHHVQMPEFDITTGSDAPGTITAES
jgi:hypothetical protein